MNWLEQITKVHESRHGKAPLYGVIVYTDRNPVITKLLRDKDYWKGLNELSGPRWEIFAITALPAQELTLPREHASKFLANITSANMMLPSKVLIEPEQNKELFEGLGISDSKQLPLLVVFQDMGSKEIVLHKIKIDETSLETAFASFRGIMDQITSALAAIHPDNIHDSFIVKQEISAALIKYKGMKVLKLVGPSLLQSLLKKILPA